MVALTEPLLLEKTKASSLLDIKNLNLWGSELDNVTVLAKMPNVEVLSLSVNKITGLEPFGKCSKLQELYLRKNEVKSLDELKYLKALEGLRVLWLCDNPCAETPDYRARIVRELPQLQKLDHTKISNEERHAAINGLPFTPDTPQRAKSPIDPMMGERKSSGSQANSAPPSRDVSRRNTPASKQHPLPPSSGAPGSRSPRRTSTASNVLYAVMALLNELDEEGLKIVKSEIDQRIAPAAVKK
uniref:U2A'/phosphoprotein 32 family A C-terminal domain-containing protein n=1 Tax=Pyramimonas obovata TaxID=1411642 RepID=A0A7S0WWI7_9CHLO|mmetsp:Transcript_7682/g.15634  ORF Transcript_7682/g.15634 Transcript_7682/m.15634 type:complete len:243 (+) Transcript_7682:58-786(+)